MYGFYYCIRKQALANGNSLFPFYYFIVDFSPLVSVSCQEIRTVFFYVADAIAKIADCETGLSLFPLPKLLQIRSFAKFCRNKAKKVGLESSQVLFTFIIYLFSYISCLRTTSVLSNLEKTSSPVLIVMTTLYFPTSILVMKS